MFNVDIIASSSKGNCYRVDVGGAPLLLECGINIARIKKALGFRLSSIAACLVTHEHKDHSMALPEMLRSGVDCYMTEGTASALGISHHRAHFVRPLVSFRVAGWDIIPFPAIHDAADPVGFLLVGGGEKILFATDTAYIPNRFNGLTRIMVECNYSQGAMDDNVERGQLNPSLRDRIVMNHFGLPGVIDMLKANDLTGLKDIHLLHLSDNNSNAGEMQSAVEKCTGVPVYL